MRVAAWQWVPVPLDVDANLVRLDVACASAREAGASVLVVPEMFTTGYAIGADAVAALAEPADGPTADAVVSLAARHDLTVAYGFPERASDGGVFNAVNVVTGEGVVATHRKVHLWGVDKEQFRTGPSAPRVFALGPVAAGALVCFDVEFPEAVRHLAVDGARLLLVPTANPVGFDEVQDVLLRARALENGTAIVYANYVGTDGALTYNGRSVIVDADGTVRAAAPSDTEILLVADVTLESASRAGYLSGRRPDLYG